MKIHLDMRVCTKLGMHQGTPSYSGYSEIEADKLIQIITSDSTKRVIEKDKNVEDINICSDGKTLAMFGSGDGWFLIGKEASDKFQRISVLNHQEDINNAETH